MTRVGVVVAQGFADQGLGVFQAAFAQISVGQGEVVELAKDFLSGVDGDVAEAGDFAADFLDGLGRKALEDFRRLLLGEGQQQDRRFAHAGKVLPWSLRAGLLSRPPLHHRLSQRLTRLAARIGIRGHHLLNLLEHLLGLDGLLVQFHAVEGRALFRGVADHRFVAVERAFSVGLLGVGGGGDGGGHAFAHHHRDHEQAQRGQDAHADFLAVANDDAAEGAAAAACCSTGASGGISSL